MKSFFSRIPFLCCCCVIMAGSHASSQARQTGREPFQQSRWITAVCDSANSDTTFPAPCFRKTFHIGKPLKQARLFVTGVGFFNCFLNGSRVDDSVLNPAVSRYDKRVYYLDYNVTGSLHQGMNAVGVTAGNGFYNVHTKSAWQFNRAPWRGHPAVICEVQLDFEDGSHAVIGTDSSWQWTYGPVVFNQLRNGEVYDARQNPGAWTTADFEAAGWQAACHSLKPAGKLVKQNMPPIRKTRRLKPVKITKPVSDCYVVDFGQNLSGWVRLKLNEPEDRSITMRYGERVFESGLLDQKELSRFVYTGDTQTTKFISRGMPEVYEPEFTWFGFQYVQIEGLSQPLAGTDIDAFMIHTAFDTIGYFKSSNALFNQIHENMQWSYLGNYHSFPEDCPHREKMGWTGDGQLMIETALFNFDAVSAYQKWMRDFMDEQRPSGDLPGIVPTSGWGYEFGKDPETRPYGYGPHWEGACITIPWQLYRYSGDLSILTEFYPMMQGYLNHLKNISVDGLLNFGIDDHKAIFTKTGGSYIGSAYFYHFTEIMARAADVLGYENDVLLFQNAGEKVYKSFQSQYALDNGVYGNGGQTALALALACGLVPEDNRAVVMARLIERIEKAEYHFDAGVVGVKAIVHVLMDYGRNDVLYKMLNQRDFPSIGFWIDQGANTLWQNWDGSQSRNHIMFGSVCDFFYQGLAGIDVIDTAPGYQTVHLNPWFPEDMDWLKCGHRASNGWIRIAWERKGQQIIGSGMVPEGSAALLCLPEGKQTVVMQANNRLPLEEGVYSLKSGIFQFTLE